MFRRRLCPNCKTGKCTYELDGLSPECPYLGCHDGRKCTMYVPLRNKKKTGFLNWLLGNANPPKN